MQCFLSFYTITVLFYIILKFNSILESGDKWEGKENFMAKSNQWEKYERTECVFMKGSMANEEKQAGGRNHSGTAFLLKLAKAET